MDDPSPVVEFGASPIPPAELALTCVTCVQIYLESSVTAREYPRVYQLLHEVLQVLALSTDTPGAFTLHIEHPQAIVLYHAVRSTREMLDELPGRLPDVLTRERLDAALKVATLIKGDWDERVRVA